MKLKQLIASVLCLCMLFSLFPAVSVNAYADNEDTTVTDIDQENQLLDEQLDQDDQDGSDELNDPNEPDKSGDPDEPDGLTDPEEPTDPENPEEPQLIGGTDVGAEEPAFGTLDGDGDGEETTEPLTIASFSLAENGQQITVGDALHFSVTFAGGNGISSVRLQLGRVKYEMGASGVPTDTWIELTEGTENVFTGSYVMSENDVDGAYCVYQIEVCDELGNNVTYFHWYDYTDDLLFKNATFSGGNSDTYGPEISDVTAPKTALQVSAGDSVSFSATITDDSGVRSAVVIMAYRGLDNSEYDRRADVVLAEQGENVFAGSYTFTEDDPDGYYTFGGLTATDTLNNTETADLNVTVKKGIEDALLYELIYNANGGYLVDYDYNQTMTSYSCAMSSLELDSNLYPTNDDKSVNFSGWYLDDGATGEALTAIPEESIGDGSVTVYAGWAPAPAISVGSNSAAVTEYREKSFAFSPAVDGLYQFSLAGDTVINAALYAEDNRQLVSNNGWDELTLRQFCEAGSTYYLCVECYDSLDLTINIESVENYYTVTFDPYGGVFSGDEEKSQIVKYVMPGESLQDDYTVITRDPDKFNDGWRVDDPVNGDIVQAYGYEPEGDVVLYANLVDAYFLTFNANGGSFGKGMSAYVHEYHVRQGEAFEFPEYDVPYIFSEIAKEFSGWYADPYCTELVCARGETFTPTKSMELYACYGDSREYKVTFDATEGYFYEPGQTTVVFYTSCGNIYSCPNPTHPDEHQALTGWYTDENATDLACEPGETFHTNEDTTLYAGWGDGWVVTFDAGDYGQVWINGRSGQTVTYAVPKGRAIGVNPAIASNDPNSTVNQWYLNPERTGDPVNVYDYVPEGDMTFYGKLVANYTVIFNAGEGYFYENGEQVKTRNGYFTEGTSILFDFAYDVRHSNPDMRFAGWYLDETLTEPACSAEEPYIVSGDVTLYAKWVEEELIHVTFNANGGFFYEDGQHVDTRNMGFRPGWGISNSTYGASNSDPALRFACWCSDPECNNPVTSKDESYFPTEGEILYAKWTRFHAVTFMANGGFFGNTESIVRYTTPGEIMGSRNREVPEMPDLSAAFAGWVDEDDNPVDLDSFAPTGDITLKATWGDGWIVTFDANGGFFPVETPDTTQYQIAVLKGSTINRSLKTPIYGETGWALGAEWRVNDAVNGELVYPAEYAPTADVTLYAVWNKMVHVTFNANGGYFYGNPDYTTYEDWITSLDPNESFGIRNDDASMVFAGWYTDSSCTGDPLTELPAESYDAGEVILYAKWEQEPTPTVTVGYNDLHVVFDGTHNRFLFEPEESGLYVFRSQLPDNRIYPYATLSSWAGRQLMGNSGNPDFEVTYYCEAGQVYWLEIWCGGNEADIPVVIEATDEAYYTVTFDGNGALVNGSAEPLVVYVIAGDSIWLRDGYVNVKSEDGTLGGYGWYLDGNYIESAKYTPTRDCTLKARLVPLHRITFKAGNGGYFFGDENVKEVFNNAFEGIATETPLPQNSDPHLAFAGWYYDKECTQLAYARGESIIPTEALTLYAGWTEGWAITFDANGGHLYGDPNYPQTLTISVPKGEKFPTGEWPGVSWDDGTVMDGWYTSDGVKVDVDNLWPTSDITLYAHSMPDVGPTPHTEVDLAFGENIVNCPAGGFVTGAFTPEESGVYRFRSHVSDGDPYASLFSQATGEYLGYNDDGGENLNFSLTYPLEAGKTYFLNVEVLGDHPVDVTIPITVERLEEYYTVTFNGNGALIDGREAPLTVYVGKGDSIGQSPYVRTADGKKGGDGWHLNSPTGPIVRDAYVYVPTADCTLYANLEPVYFITLDARGGYFWGDEDLTVVERDFVAGTKWWPDEPEWPKDPDEPGDILPKKVFDGWYYDAKCTKLACRPNDPYEVTGATTLYAKWKNTWEVTLDANGGYFANGAESRLDRVIAGYDVGYNVTVLNSTPNRALKGWNTKADGTGQRIGLLADYVPTADVTLYAQWDYAQRLEMSLDSASYGYCDVMTVSVSFVNSDGSTAGIEDRGNTNTLVWVNDSNGNQVQGLSVGYEKGLTPVIEIPLGDASMEAGTYTVVASKMFGTYIVCSETTFEYTGYQEIEHHYEDYRISLSLDPGVIADYDTMEMKAVVTDGEGNPVKGVKVDFILLDQSWEEYPEWYRLTGVTKADGTAHAKIAFVEDEETPAADYLMKAWIEDYPNTYARQSFVFTGATDPVKTGSNTITIGNGETFVPFTPTESGYYRFSANSKEYIYGELLDSNHQTLDGDYTYNSTDHAGIRLFAYCEAGQTYLVKMGGRLNNSVKLVIEPVENYYTVTFDSTDCYITGASSTDGQYAVKVPAGDPIGKHISAINDANTLYCSGWRVDDPDSGEFVEDVSRYVPTGDVTLYPVFKKVFVVTLDANRGGYFDSEDGSSETEYVIYATPGSIMGAMTGMVRSNTPEKTFFDGWYFDSDCTKLACTRNGSFRPAQSTTLYAKWNKGWVISFDANGGSFGDSSETVKQYAVPKGEHFYTEVPNPSKEGDERFIGWRMGDPETGAQYNEFNLWNVDLTGDVTFYAVYASEHYNITILGNGGYFPMNGRESTIVELEPGVSFSPNSILRRMALVWNGEENLGITGWYSADDPDTLLCTVDGSFTPTGDMVIFPKWGGAYTVVFEPNFTGPTAYSQSIAIGAKTELNELWFLRDHYTFKGWNTKANGSGKAYADGASVLNLAKKNGATVKLYAQWTPDKYTVKFDANGGMGTMKNQSFSYGKTAALTANAFKRTGYLFVGWSSDFKAGASSVQFQNKAKVQNLSFVNGDTVTLYAVWEPISYRIAYNANRGTGDMSYDGGYCSYDKTYTLEANHFARAGFTFTGWNTKADGKGKSFADEAEISNLSTKNGATITLYAQWEAHSYNIEFSPNNVDIYGDTLVNPVTGTMNTMANRVCGKTYTLTANAFACEGYTFLGWSKDSGAQAADYKNKQKKVSFTEDTILCAVWKPVEYKITYKNIVAADGNTNPATYTVKGAITLTDPVRSGSIFGGWYYDAAFTKPVEGDLPYVDEDGVYHSGNQFIPEVMPSAKTLYAKWTVNKEEAQTYTITFDANNGTEAKKEMKGCVFGKNYTLTANAFKRAGFNFAGWSTSPDGMIEYSNKQKNVSFTEDTTLYAVWTPVLYKVTYKNVAASPEENPNSPMYMTNLEDGLKLTDPTRPGCTFLGWYYDAKFTKPVEGDLPYVDEDGIYHSGDQYIPEGMPGAKTLYARWEGKVTYTIHFERNDVDNSGHALLSPVKGTMKNLTKRVNGTVYTLTKNAFKCTGYTFAGWSYTTSGDMKYKDKAKVVNLADENGTVTLYAIWVPTPYTITYKNVDDSVTEGRYTIKDVTNGRFLLPNDLGEGFFGWFYDAKFTKPVEGTLPFISDEDHGIAEDDHYVPGEQYLPAKTTGNKTLYAKWVLAPGEESTGVNG